jgi:hypothetical protein
LGLSAALMHRGEQYGQYLTPKFCTFSDRGLRRVRS